MCAKAIPEYGLFVHNSKTDVAHRTVRVFSLSRRSIIVAPTQIATGTLPYSLIHSPNVRRTSGVESFFLASLTSFMKANRASRLPSPFAFFLTSRTKSPSSFILPPLSGGRGGHLPRPVSSFNPRTPDTNFRLSKATSCGRSQKRRLPASASTMYKPHN